MGGKKAVSAVWILGWVFSLLGGLFMILGGGLWYGLRYTRAWVTGPVFLIVGGLFLAIGAVFLALDIRHRRRLRRLLESGRYVWGEVTALEPDPMMRIQDRNPYYAVVRYTDPFGRVSIFRSQSSMALWRRGDLEGRQVKVYVEDDTCKNYAVDISGLLD